jgi:hypothetical protein
MPNYFKGLATVTVWILWLSGLVMGFSMLGLGIIGGDLYNPDVPMPMEYSAGFAVALAYGLGAVVIMILRKKME